MEDDKHVLGTVNILKSMWDKHKKREEEARLSMATDNTSPISFGANVKKETQQQEKARYLERTSMNRKDMFAEAFANFNLLMEGETTSFYNPGKGTSGWTVGQGIDIGQTSRADAIALGMPNQLIEVADKYDAWGKQGMAVPKEVKQIAVDQNTPEWSQFRTNIAATKVPIMEQIAKTNPNLSTRAIVTLAQMDHWAGSIYSEADAMDKLTRSTTSLETAGTNKSTAEGFINPIAKYLENGNATDEGLVETINTIRKSYGESRPLNSTTMDRYSSFLTVGSV